MPCFHPITALQPSGGGPLLFPDPQHFYLFNDYRTVTIGCGQCSGCRLKHSRDWAIRCWHERQNHRHNSYITLTYEDKNLPPNNSLRHYDFQCFMKRLRKALLGRGHGLLCTTFKHGGPSTPSIRQPSSGRDGLENRKPAVPETNLALATARAINRASQRDVRYYMSGEYGERYGRPHYHAILFGVDFSDRLYFKRSPSGERIYRSTTLEKLWTHGYSSVGDVTFESAAYVARYIMKKQTGDGLEHYEIIDPDTGEIYLKQKEYSEMSTKPAIGLNWITRYTSDVYTTGKLIGPRGHQHYPPRYYDKIFRKLDAAALEDFQHQRYLEQLAQTEHHTPDRLAVQEAVQNARTRSLKRNLETGVT